MSDRFSPGICAVCRKRETGIGVRMPPSSRGPILWTCGEPDCITLARNTYPMKPEVFSRLESRAAVEGGDEDGGAYLTQIGKTDLAELSEEERWELWRRVVAGYCRRVIGSAGEAPF